MMDEGERLMKRGDVLIERATNHSVVQPHQPRLQDGIRPHRRRQNQRPELRFNDSLLTASAAVVIDIAKGAGPSVSVCSVASSRFRWRRRW